MKVQAILESGRNRVVLVAEDDAECRALGVIGTDVIASIRQHFDGHPAHGKVDRIEITMEQRTPEPGPMPTNIEDPRA